MTPGMPRRMTAQSCPGVRFRRDSQPSIHLPRSVYLPATKTGSAALMRFSFSAKKSSLAASTLPPARSPARSSISVKRVICSHCSAALQRSTAQRGSRQQRAGLTLRQAQGIGRALHPLQSSPGCRTVRIHHTPAQPRLVYHAEKLPARIGRHLVPLAEAAWFDSELGLGVPDDEVGVVARSDRALAPLEA